MILKLLFLAYFQGVVIESGIVSEGSIKGVLSGKHYNRLVSCHKVMYEALHHLQFQSFLDSITDENQELASFIESMARSFPDDEFLNKYVESPMMQKILDSYELFINDMSSKSRTCCSLDYWSLPRVERLILRNYFHIALKLSHFCCLQQQEDL